MTRASFLDELACTGAEIVRKLGGSWHGDRGTCLCPAHDDHDPSLSVRVGRSALLFKCFAGCDTLEVLRAVGRLDLPLANRRPIPDAARSSPPERSSARAAERIWQASLAIEGTPGARYLRGRGLIPPWPDLRYHPRTPLGRGRNAAFRPAIIAAVREGRHLTAIHRTFLDPVTAAKASDLDNPRRMLGRPGKGAVQLMPATSVLGLAEGIETALAAMQIHRVPVWAVLGAERAARIALPDGLERLILLFDDDPAGWRAEQRARGAYPRPGLSILSRRPGANDNDWAAVLERRRGPVRAA